MLSSIEHVAQLQHCTVLAQYIAYHTIGTRWSDEGINQLFVIYLVPLAIGMFSFDKMTRLLLLKNSNRLGNVGRLE